MAGAFLAGAFFITGFSSFFVAMWHHLRPLTCDTGRGPVVKTTLVRYLSPAGVRLCLRKHAPPRLLHPLTRSPRHRFWSRPPQRRVRIWGRTSRRTSANCHTLGRTLVNTPSNHQAHTMTVCGWQAQATVSRQQANLLWWCPPRATEGFELGGRGLHTGLTRAWKSSAPNIFAATAPA